MIIDMRRFPTVCDYFVIASGSSTTQVRAISDNVIKELKDAGEKPWHVEGEREALWMLIDYGDVVVHVFNDDTRKFYDLERLWIDAPQKQFAEEPAKRKVAGGRPARKKAARKSSGSRSKKKSVKKPRKKSRK